MLKSILHEPVLLGATLRAIVLAAMTFGLHVTDVQLAAVMGALEAVLALLTRAGVTPNSLAEERVAAGGSPTVPRNLPVVLLAVGLGLLTMMSSCGGKVSPITVPTVTQNALIAAQDIEAQLCWGVANAKASVPDRTHCTTDNAKFIKLTDERHKVFNSKLAVAFDLHKELTAQVRAGRSVDLTRLQAIITEVLDLVGQLTQTPLVVELAANVKEGGVIR